MGLGVRYRQHCMWSAGYSSFNNWRRNLCQLAGLGSVEQYDSWGGPRTWPDHDLTALLSHSDCEGELSPEECERTARGLERLLPSLDCQPPERSVLYPLRTDAQIARAWIAGCRAAAKRGQRIRFH